MKFNCEKQKEDELESLRSHLSENFREKMACQQGHYEQRIVELEKRLIETEVEKDNKELQMPKLREIADNSDLKELLTEKNERFDNEIEQLRVSLKKKNDEIKNILSERLVA